ncbi:MAG: amino acid adenylation domain-containing protein [Desulfobacterium sp.]|nr:amino acid adenylation domain-containing protein [Desulfobacterium sp.]
MSASDAIAVIGMSCRFPGAKNIDRFWNNLKNGVESITAFSDRELADAGVRPSDINHPDYVKAGYVLGGEDLFDASFFGFSPKEAELLDPQHRLFLESAWEALEDSGYATGQYDGSIGVFAGAKMSTYLINVLNSKRLSVGGASDLQVLIANDKDYLTSRVSYKLNLKGPSITVQSACSTSLVAIHLACDNLLSGACDMSLAGGVSISIPQKTGYLFQEGMILSPDGHCRAFDADAKGVTPGNGVGVVLLKRLEDAIKDHDDIHAVVLGSAVNNDGSNKIGYTTPGVEGQVEVVREAQAVSGIGPEAVSYIEAHGTGTSLGDPVEIKALNRVFKTETDRKGFCAIGSVKTNIGHLDTAAGIAGFIKTVLSLKHGYLLPSLNYEHPNPKIDFQNSPFYVNTQLLPWETGGEPRRAGISSFGLGGTNAHVILEEAPARHPGRTPFKRPLHLLTLSAKTENALNRQILQYQSFLDERRDLAVDNICFTANAGRTHFPYRFATLADSTDTLRAQLAAAPQKAERQNSFEGVVQNETRQGVAFLFTGQGSQYPGMGEQLYKTQPCFKKEMDKCDSILKRFLGCSILSILFENQDPSMLNKTIYSQPAIFALEYSLARMWGSWGIKPDIVLGHSVGEYVAGCISGVFSLEDGLKLIAERGRLMQAISGDGAMFSVFAPEEKIREIILPYSDDVSLAAINGPLHTVISGSLASLGKIVADLKSQKIVSRRLAVSHGFHSPMMAPMVADFKKTVDEVKFFEPRIRLVSNVTGQVVEAEFISTPDYWCRHILEPVRFFSGMMALEQAGYEQFLEIGPAPVLLSMGQQCLPAEYGSWLPTLGRNSDDWQQVLRSLGNLYVSGAMVDWEAFEQGYDSRRISLPTYPFERQRYWAGPRAKESNEIFNDDSPDPMFYEIDWQPDLLPKETEGGVEKIHTPGHWLIFSDHGGVGQKLTNLLASQGDSCIQVYTDTRFFRMEEDKYGVNPSNLEDFDQIFRLMPDTVSELGIIHLWSMDAAPNETLTADALQRAGLEGWGSLLNIVQSVAKKSRNMVSRFCIVTQEVHGIKNHSSSVAVAQAPISGLAKVLSREHPELNCLSIDLDRLVTEADRLQLLEAVRSVRPDNEFVFRGGVCYVPRLVHCLPDLNDGKTPSSFNRHGTYLITGAFGGLGIELARWLVNNGVRFLLMMGRKAPSGDVLKCINDLENTGTQVTTVIADVCDYDDLSCGFDRISEEMPPLKGVFHLAGILKTGTILGHSHEDFSEILAPKVAGSWNLHLLTQHLPLDLFVLFSSSSTLWGIQGVGGYTAANTFMDILAHYRKGQGVPALSINWGAWSKVGAAAKLNLEDRLSNQGFNSIPPEKGLGCLGGLLRCDIRQVGVMDVDWETFLGRFPWNARPPIFIEMDKSRSSVTPAPFEKSASAVRNSPSLDKLQKLPVHAQQKSLESYLRGEISRVLHLEKDTVANDQNLIQMGLDSLIFIELSRTLSEDLQIKVVPHKIFENPTITAMAEQFVRDIALEKRISVFDYRTSQDFVITHDADNRYSPFELTDIQQAYWIGRSNSMELGNIACHVYVEVDVVNLDLARYNRAWQILINRHEMLRAVILPTGKQKILESVPDYRIASTDLMEKSPEEIHSALRFMRDEMSHQVLDPETWPIFDIRVSRIHNGKSRIHLSLDMLIIDALSVAQINQELHQLYLDEETPLPPLALSFRDYVLAGKQFEQSVLYRQSKAYWMNRLDSIPPGPELPLIKNPSGLTRPRFKRRSLRLEPDTWNRLKEKSAKAGLTPSGLLLACYAEILAAWSKTARFTINMTLFNRLPVHPQVNDIIGDFTSLIMLVVDNTGQDSFIRRAQKIQKQFWEDVEHRHFSGIRALRELSRANPSGNTTMPVIFTSNIVYGDLEGGGSESPAMGDVVYSVTQTPQVWLDHQITEQGNALILDWDALEALFPAGLLDDMFNAYHSLLNRLADSDDAWHANHQLLPGFQSSQRVELNRTTPPISAETLNSLFATQVEKQPDETAVVSVSEKISYRVLFHRSNQIAALVANHGIMPNTLVAVVMEKGWEQVVAVLGILNSGAAYLPIDPSVPKERLWHLLKDCEVRLVLTQSRLDRKLEWPENIKRLPVDAQDFTHKNGLGLKVEPTPDDLAYVIHTSGSTGLPKGVMIDHRGAVNTVLDINKRFGLGPGDSVLALSALNFDLSVFDIFGTLAAGGTIVMPDALSIKDPGHWLTLMKQEKVTLWNSVPALMQMLVEHLEGTREHVPDQLRLVLLSGDWIPLDLPGKIKASARHAEVISLGGATEASIWSILYPIGGVDPQWNSIPYGRAMTHQSFHVLNENMDDCPDWVTGQLYIGGTGLAKGYWRDKEKTGASFIRHPETGMPLYRTGDLGRFLPDGNIEFMGREDQQVKINGYRIELGEIESSISQFPGVEEVVVIATDHGRVNKQLIAYVRLAGGLGLDSDPIKAFLREKLPFYLIPAQIIALDAFPLNHNGKIDRNALPLEPVDAPPPGGEDSGSQSPLTKEILDICAGLFNVADISGRDNFFELGGNSLLGIRFINQLRDKYKIDLTLRTFFEEPNLHGIVKKVETALQMEPENKTMEEGVI